MVRGIADHHVYLAWMDSVAHRLIVIAELVGVQDKGHHLAVARLQRDAFEALELLIAGFVNRDVAENGCSCGLTFPHSQARMLVTIHCR